LNEGADAHESEAEMLARLAALVMDQIGFAYLCEGSPKLGEQRLEANDTLAESFRKNIPLSL